jgi:hypothetical protein
LLSCLPRESFCVNASCHGFPGWGVLAFGWIEVVIFPIPGVCWLANPALVLTWLQIAMSHRTAAILGSLGSTVLGAAFLLSPRVLVSESGNPDPVQGYAIGYWLWLASMGASVASALLVPRIPARPR